MSKSFIDDYGFKQTYIIICDTGDMLIKCSKDELHNILMDLYKDKDINVVEYFVYKSQEYYMYKEGDNYDINKNYAEKCK